MAAAALEQSETRVNGDLSFLTSDVEALFDSHTLLHLPPVLLRRAIRLAAGAIGGELSFEQTMTVESHLRSGEKGAITAEGAAVSVEWNSERLHVRLLQPVEPFRYPITVPGETASDEFGWQFMAERREAPTLTPIRRSLEVEIAASSVKGPLYFRTAEPGDLMMPLGFDKKRKLGDLLSEAKLTQAARRRLPIVCDLVGPLWAPGICLDERSRPTGGAVIWMNFGPLAQTK
jgi:tRNA(Ile)-lysidine synthase